MNFKFYVSEKFVIVYNIVFFFVKNVLEKLYVEILYNFKDNVLYLLNNVWFN